MRSFKLEKVRGDENVTHEALLWLAVFVFVIAPALGIVYYIAS